MCKIGTKLNISLAAMFHFYAPKFVLLTCFAAVFGKEKNWGVTDFVLEKTCPEEHLKFEKIRHR